MSTPEEEALNLGAAYKEADNENIVVGGPIEVHILDKSGQSKEELQDNNEDDEEEDVDAITLEARIVAKENKRVNG